MNFTVHSLVLGEVRSSPRVLHRVLRTEENPMPPNVKAEIVLWGSEQARLEDARGCWSY